VGGKEKKKKRPEIFSEKSAQLLDEDKRKSIEVSKSVVEKGGKEERKRVWFRLFGYTGEKGVG